LINKFHTFFAFLFFAPIFISITNNGGIVFDRFHFRDLEIFSLTLPVSLIIALILLSMNFFQILLKKEVFLFSLLSIFAILLNVLTAENSSYLNVVLKVLFFILILFSFEHYFKKFKDIPIGLSPYKALMFVLVLSILSAIIYRADVYYFISKEVAIYNFQQYFPIIFILLMGICAHRKSLFIFLLSLSGAMFLSIAAQNLTSIFIVLTFSALWLFTFFINQELLKQLSLGVTFLCVMLPFLYFFLAVIFFDSLNPLLPESLAIRVEGVYMFFNNASWSDIIFPIQLDPNVPGDHYHNEPISILSTIGIVGTLLFYLIILNKIIQLNNNYPYIAISISLVIFFGGLTILPLLHPYTGIIIAYVISYYSSKSSSVD